MFGFLGGGKKSSDRGRGAPTQRVMSMASQGVSEPEIIRTLKTEGYSPREVDTAMREALSSSIGGPQRFPPARQSADPIQQPPPDFPPIPGPPQQQNVPAREAQALGMPPLPGESGFDSGLPGDPQAPNPPLGDEPIQGLDEKKPPREAKESKRRAIEEMVEGVIEEKWVRFITELDDMRNQFDSIDKRIKEIELSIKKVEDQKKTDIDDIEEKIDTYKESIEEVSSRMGAVESAVKNSMQPMMETLRSLSDTVKSMKDDQDDSDLPKPPK